MLDLVLPRFCVVCRRRGVALCAECAGPQPVSPFWVQPTVAPGGADETVAAGASYGDAVARVVVAWKERGRVDLQPFLAHRLAAAVALALTDTPPRGAEVDGEPEPEPRPVLVPGRGPGPVLVPVPSTRAARRRRGQDGVLVLARLAAAALRREAHPGLRVVPALRVRRTPADQGGLDAVGRLQNMDGVFEVRSDARRLLRGCRIVLVDDVLTTGATLAAAAGVLVDCPATLDVRCAVVAATPMRRAVRPSGDGPDTPSHRVSDTPHACRLPTHSRVD